MKAMIEPTPPFLIDPTGRYLIPNDNRTAILDTETGIVIRCEEAWSAYQAFRAIVRDRHDREDQ